MVAKTIIDNAIADTRPSALLKRLDAILVRMDEVKWHNGQLEVLIAEVDQIVDALKELESLTHGT